MSRVPSKTPSREQGSKTPSATKTPKTPSAIRSQKTPSAASVKDAPAKEKEFELPALSVAYKPKVTESELEKLRKKTIRRNAPPGEDLNQIKEILKRLRKQKISVQEFISLVAPSTADRGEALRSVMQEDLNNFRKLARKVYDTVTQDNSDVLHNQQIQLSEYYKEKKALLHDKMMRHIDEIYAMVPDFSLERYASEGQKYLAEVLPVPEELKVEPEEYEMMKRQAAYHRLQWLRSEGIRLNEENNSLKKRLNQLKKMHRDEQLKMTRLEKEAEAKRAALEAQQAEKAETLEMLNESLERSIIDRERSMRQSKDKILHEPVSSKEDVKKKKKKGAVKKRPPWNEEAAREIETRAVEEQKAADKATASKTRPRSPFRYSPIKTPPQAAPPVREVSPFHYSPPKTPPDPSTVILPQRPGPPRLGRRPATAPRDSFGGFF